MIVYIIAIIVGCLCYYQMSWSINHPEEYYSIKYFKYIRIFWLVYTFLAIVGLILKLIHNE